MAAPKSDDPKRPVTLSLRASTLANIESRLRDGQSVGKHLSAAVEAKYGLSPAGEARQHEDVTPRLKR